MGLQSEQRVLSDIYCASEKRESALLKTRFVAVCRVLKRSCVVCRAQFALLPAYPVAEVIKLRAKGLRQRDSRLAGECGEALGIHSRAHNLGEQISPAKRKGKAVSQPVSTSVSLPNENLYFFNSNNSLKKIRNNLTLLSKITCCIAGNSELPTL